MITLAPRGWLDQGPDSGNGSPTIRGATACIYVADSGLYDDLVTE